MFGGAHACWECQGASLESHLDASEQGSIFHRHLPPGQSLIYLLWPLAHSVLSTLYSQPSVLHLEAGLHPLLRPLCLYMLPALATDSSDPLVGPIYTHVLFQFLKPQQELSPHFLHAGGWMGIPNAWGSTSGTQIHHVGIATVPWLKSFSICFMDLNATFFPMKETFLVTGTASGILWLISSR